MNKTPALLQLKHRGEPHLRRFSLCLMLLMTFLQLDVAAIDAKTKTPKVQNHHSRSKAGSHSVVPKAGADTAQASRPKIALVLGGGGARGAAHIGVLKVLEENHLRPDIIVANSMGSVIGSLYCAGVDLDRIEKLCLDGEVKKAFTPAPVPLQILGKITRPRIPFRKREKYPGLYSGKKLEEFISKNVGEKYQQIEDLPIPLAVTVVNLVDGQAYRMTKGNLGRLVRASCSIPPLLRPVELDGMVLADGGIRANLPTYAARDLGADVVIAVNVDELLKEVDKDEFKNVTGLANRVTSVILAARDELHSKEADLVLHPDVSGISIVSVEDADYAKAIAVGRSTTEEALPKLRQLFEGISTATRERKNEQNLQ